MGWKSLVWAGCLAPALAGCGTIPLARGPADEAAPARRAIRQDSRRDARAAWQCVRDHHPQRVFTADFQDGFLAGFTDCQDRGEPGQPPPKYVQEKRYFTPEGLRFVRDYYRGFKYGTDVALAAGGRQVRTVPALLTEHPRPASSAAYAYSGPIAPVVPYVTSAKPAGPVQPRPLPLTTPRPLTSDTRGKFDPPYHGDPFLPADEQPESDAPPAAPPPTTGGPSKFTPALPVPPRNEDLLPVPNPPVPTLPVPPGPDKLKLPVPPASGSLFPDSVPSGLRLLLPDPPDDVPRPSIFDNIPVVPFEFVSPPPLPPTVVVPQK